MPPEPGSLRALVFDVNGTLAATERDGHRVAFNQAFADAGLDWHWDPELYDDLLRVTGGKERIRHYCERFRRDWLDGVGGPAGEDSGGSDDSAVTRAIAGLHAAKTEHYTQLVAEGRVPLLPGVAALLSEARAAGLRLAIATTTTPANVTALLTATLGAPATDWFEVIGAGDVVDAKKPAPDVYRWVLDRLGLSGAECLAFEDSVNGCRSAVGAGLPTVVIPSPQDVDAEFPEALTVLPSLAETDLAALRGLHASITR